MKTQMENFRPVLGLLLAAGVSAAAVAGCGGGSGGGGPYGSAASHPTRSVTAARYPGHPAAPGAIAGIPQHNGGDHDSDNNGGPSDGDGNL